MKELNAIYSGLSNSLQVAGNAATADVAAHEVEPRLGVVRARRAAELLLTGCLLTMNGCLRQHTQHKEQCQEV